MTTQEYQDFCKKGLKSERDLAVFLLGLGGETGECLDLFKKAKRDQVPLDKTRLIEELGDVCWYIANICTELHISIDSVLEANKQKLKKRYNIKEN